MPEFLFSSLDCYRSLRSFFILRFSRRILRLAAMLARSSTVVHSLRCASCKTQTASTITRKICASFAFYASLRLAGDVGRSTAWWRLMPPAPRFAWRGMCGSICLSRLSATRAARFVIAAGWIDRYWPYKVGRGCTEYCSLSCWGSGRVAAFYLLLG